MIFRKPLTDEQKKRIAEREKPTQEEINQAADSLIMYLMEEVESLKQPTLRGRRKKEV